MTLSFTPHAVVSFFLQKAFSRTVATIGALCVPVVGVEQKSEANFA